MSDRAIGWPFAEVAVDVPLRAGPGAGARRSTGDTFDYGVPPDLVDQLRPGHLVRVPFGRRQVLGIVIALRASSLVERTRDIGECLEGEPALRSTDIALARWMSAYYLAPFFECLRCFLPPGGPGGQVRHLVRGDAPLESDRLRGLPDAGRAILGLLAGEPDIDEDAIARAGIARATDGIEALEAAGLVRVEMRLRRARVKPRLRQLAIAKTSSEAEVDLALRALRPNRKADVIAFLRRPDQILPSLEAVRAASAARPAELRALQAAGLLVVGAAETRLECPLTPEQANALAEGELATAPEPARLLTRLAQAEGPIERERALAELGLHASALEPLLAAGYVHAIELPSSVLLEARGGRAREIELDLRRAAPHAEAMAFLAASGGVAALSAIRSATRAQTRHLRELAEAGLIELGDEQVWRDPLAGASRDAPSPSPPLTEDQARAGSVLQAHRGLGSWAARRPRVSFAARPDVCLLHGVTGSGKTELYLRAIEHTLFQGRQAIVLVPEIALTPQTVRRFAGRFPGRVGVWHSELSEGERLDTWERARRGYLDVIVGSRSAVFAPLPRLGLIVLDESHGEAYKQARSPRYHARDLAIRRGALNGALVLLGSATPAVESYWEALRGAYTLLELPRRVATRRSSEPAPAAAEVEPAGRALGASGAAARPEAASAPAAAEVEPASRVATVDWGEMPPVRIVDLRAELKAGNRSIFSRALQTALDETLAEGGQAILFLNRRGSATFVLCRDCGEVLTCPRCATPLTQHRIASALVCHHCNHHQAPPMMCPVCGSARIRYFGAGTEQVESAARERFPEARLLRWDADTTGRKGAHEAILARFVSGGADILIGTQMIAKGLDLPRVTLVGVVSADTGLHFPDFRSAERSFQLLSQVAGRAGRSERGGQVILQTYAPEHPAILAAAAHDYAAFYTREIAFRQAQGYPPFGKLVRLIHVTEHGDRAASREASRVAEALRARIEALGLAEARVIGPAPAFFAQVRGRRRWHLLVQARDPHALLADFQPGPGWRIDVDAIDLL